jgi:hypothetical protein
MLSETIHRIPFTVIGQCYLVRTSHWLQGKWQESTCHGRLPGWFSRSKAASCKHSQYQHCCFRVCEAGYWKYFQNLWVISKEHAKTLSLILSSTKKQNIVKTIRVSTKSTYYHKPSQNIHLVIQPLQKCTP